VTYDVARQFAWDRGTNVTGTIVPFVEEGTGTAYDANGKSVLDYDTYANRHLGFLVYQGTIMLPMTGYRRYNNSQLTEVGNKLLYWTSSASARLYVNPNHAFGLSVMSETSMQTAYEYPRNGFGAIRCIKN
jgi:hypothetical protein